jgi:tetratricopeptide (TPR) repeat protein
MVGPEGVDRFGYPKRNPSRIGFVALLHARKLDQIEAYITRLQSEFEADFRKEYWPRTALMSFSTGDPALTAIFDQWVAASPQSFVAVAARGFHYSGLGWRARGREVASELTREQTASYKHWFELAERDLQKAIELRPRLVAAHERLLIDLGMWGHKSDPRTMWLKRSLTACPECVSARRSYLHFLKPRWGGSYPKMKDFIEQTIPLRAKNPRLVVLETLPHLDRCDILHRKKKDYEAAELECQRAHDKAPSEWRPLYERSIVRMKQKRYDQALADVSRAIEREPQEEASRRQRAILLIHAKEYLAAARDVLIARRLAPFDSWITRVAWEAVKGVIYVGHQHFTATRDKAAIAAFNLGLQIVPGNPDLQKRLAFAQARGGMAELRKRVKAHPGDFELHRQLDYALASKRKFNEVVQMWNAFLERNPNHARAHYERAGAHRHLRHRRNMAIDLRKACELGLVVACKQARRMGI